METNRQDGSRQLSRPHRRHNDFYVPDRLLSLDAQSCVFVMLRMEKEMQCKVFEYQIFLMPVIGSNIFTEHLGHQGNADQLL